VDGLIYLHEKAEIIHCDIKEENIMRDREMGIKIIDFGCAQFLIDKDKKKLNGTL